MSAVIFDVCAFIIMAVLVFSVISRKMTNGRVNRVFLGFLFINLVTDAFDIWAIVMDVSENREIFGMAARYISHTGYLFLHNLTSVFYLVYMTAITDTWHKVPNRKVMDTFVVAVTALYASMFVLNFFIKGFVFYFDEELLYQRGTVFPLLYVYAFTFILAGTYCLIKYRKLFPPDKFRALLMIFTFGIITVLIQWINRELRVEMLGGALSLLYVSIMVQRPEDRIDPATGLLKYEAYAADMKKNFINDKHVTSIIINISNFNTLNGMLNYDGMNSLLKTIADIIAAIDKDLKAFSEIYYLDRGRFRVVLNTSEEETIYLIAEKINFSMKQGVSFNGMSLDLMTYVCITRCPEDVPDFKTLMLFGNDIHNRVPYTGQVMRASDIAEKSPFGLGNELDEIIDRAITEKKFKVYYQPIYSTVKKRFVSAEALIRLKDEKYGFISPEVFIVAAERSGAIHKIGDFVMEEVCRFIASEAFEKLGLEYIEVNLSVAQCMSPGLAEKILEIMKKYGVPPEKINLEITETAADYAQNIMTENINRLYGEGFSFSLDDYGTGYSNINRVASLPLTIVKLDKSFVVTEDNPRMWIIVRNTVKMLKSMNMHIVVEGVETKQLLEKFTDLECDYIQGYYFSKPVPEEDFVKFVANSLA
ncbi:MAG: GGDEF domain-containing phosphodiesterase [Ruminococcus sp.]|nr:GGDEF domain-containing phosphodiesterase [Ruminococcus sp.]MCM1381469.1 GGDEF domain-containing phosphodiesterase [Muribaculaceae bacterium]MCM1480387.1 GGDEF domain-containing phosphodiesterase [Muribaculaceae bacterium]